MYYHIVYYCIVLYCIALCCIALYFVLFQDLYETFNILIRRKPKENNFKVLKWDETGLSEEKGLKENRGEKILKNLILSLPFLTFTRMIWDRIESIYWRTCETMKRKRNRNKSERNVGKENQWRVWSGRSVDNQEVLKKAVSNEKEDGEKECIWAQATERKRAQISSGKSKVFFFIQAWMWQTQLRFLDDYKVPSSLYLIVTTSNNHNYCSPSEPILFVSFTGIRRLRVVRVNLCTPCKFTYLSGLRVSLVIKSFRLLHVQ